MKYILKFILACTYCLNGCQSKTEVVVTGFPESVSGDLVELHIDCLNCDGSGKVLSIASGEYIVCNICNGSGKVISSKLLKNDQEIDNNLIEEAKNYICPRCGGLGMKTDITEYGVQQSKCSLCFGSGKVNELTYQSFNQ